MEEKKYILTDETMEFEGHTLHRIQAVKDLPRIYICRGSLGGWIESEDNLSQEGGCWIFNGSKVMDKARVINDALVRTSIVRDDAVISHQAIAIDCDISGLTRVAHYAYITSCIAKDAAMIYDRVAMGFVQIQDEAEIRGMTKIVNRSLSERVIIRSVSDFLTIGPIGSRDDYTTFYRANNDIYVTCGCFSGSIDEFAERVYDAHKGAKIEKDYEQAIMMAKQKLGGGGIRKNYTPYNREE